MTTRPYACHNRPPYRQHMKVQDGHWDDGVQRIPKLTSVPFRMAMQNFLWTQQAQAALWPHLNPDQRYAMVDAWSRG